MSPNRRRFLHPAALLAGGAAVGSDGAHASAVHFKALEPHVLRQSDVNIPSRDMPDWQHAHDGSNPKRLNEVKREHPSPPRAGDAGLSGAGARGRRIGVPRRRPA